jgi:hypothetical protein
MRACFLPECAERMGSRIFLICILMFVAPVGCMHPSTPTVATAPAPQRDSAHPGHAEGWVEAKLYFGLGPADHLEQGVSEAQWRDFLDKEVTPRFPDGLSVLDAYGQWNGKNEAAPERLRSKLLVIDFADSSENRAKIEAIRAAWKERTGDQSVLSVIQPAEVSF